MAGRKVDDCGNMTRNELIRAIQQAEGDADCFARLNVNDCNQMNCLWRGECSNAFSKTLANMRKDH